MRVPADTAMAMRRGEANAGATPRNPPGEAPAAGLFGSMLPGRATAGAATPTRPGSKPAPPPAGGEATAWPAGTQPLPAGLKPLLPAGLPSAALATTPAGDPAQQPGTDAAPAEGAPQGWVLPLPAPPAAAGAALATTTLASATLASAALPPLAAGAAARPGTVQPRRAEATGSTNASLNQAFAAPGLVPEMPPALPAEASPPAAALAEVGLEPAAPASQEATSALPLPTNAPPAEMAQGFTVPSAPPAPPATTPPPAMAPAMPPPQVAAAAQQVALRLAHAVSRGVDSIAVDLRPPELGRVELRLTFRDGQVQVVVAAERAETFEAFRQDRTQLEQQMSQAGINLGGGSLDLHHGRLPPEEPPPPAARATPEAEASADSAAAPATPTRRVAPERLFDFIA